MACTFPITITGSADNFVANAKAKVEAAGGTFNGDSDSGNFDVPLPLGQGIIGNYAVNGQQMTVNITKKPFIIGCGAIQNYVNTHL